MIDNVSKGQKILASSQNQLIDRVNGNAIPSKDFFGTEKGNLFFSDAGCGKQDADQYEVLFKVKRQLANTYGQTDPDATYASQYQLSTFTNYYYINIGDARTLSSHIRAYGKNADGVAIVNLNDAIAGHLYNSSRQLLLDCYDYPTKLYSNINGYSNTSISTLVKPNSLLSSLEDKRNCLFGAVIGAKQSDGDNAIRRTALVISDFRLDDPGLSSLNVDWKSVVQSLFTSWYPLELSSIVCYDSNIVFAEQDANELTALSTTISSEYFYQVHTGDIKIEDQGPLLPWKVDPATLSIERPYCQIGTYQFDSGIVSALAAGQKEMSSDYAPQYCLLDLSCLTAELSSQPLNNYRTASFKMFRIREDRRVEYYCINPVVPCWELYYDSLSSPDMAGY